MVVCKKRNKISCFTFGEPDCFTAERGKLSCLSFHLSDSFDFSWTSTWNIKHVFSSPYSPVNATKHEKPSASIIGEKKTQTLQLAIRKENAPFPRKVQEVTSNAFKDSHET